MYVNTAMRDNKVELHNPLCVNRMREKRAVTYNLMTPGGGGGGYFLVNGYWGCAAGWGRIFTTGLTIMELNF